MEPKVAVAVLVAKRGAILLVQRDNEPAEGLWSLPGGFVDAGEDPRAAAVRECWEETGLQIRITGIVDIIHAAEDGGADIVIVFTGVEEAGSLAAGDDARAAVFFEPKKLPELAFEATRRAIAAWQHAP